MRWLSQLPIIFILCLVVMALPAAPAQADGVGPYITLDLDYGVPGTNVTVRGYNFTAPAGLDIYYYLDTTNTTNRKRVAEVETVDEGYFRVTFEVPESPKGVHEVRAAVNDTTYAEADFEVKPGLTVSPVRGPVGINVTVQGHGFAKNETGIELRYYLDGSNETKAQNIRADGDGWWQTSFQIPPSAMGNHKIDAKGNSSGFTAVQDAFFKVTPGIIIIDPVSGSTIDKPSGTVGENITMTGNGFVSADTHITILFAGKEVETEIIMADDKGYWQENFEVPDMPKGIYNVTAYGQETLKEYINVLSFEIKPGIVLSPDEGHVGTDLSVTGGGFAPNRDVVIMYEGKEVETTTTNSSGSFRVVFPVPESQHGARQVVAGDDARNNATAIFTMESVPPPVPELKSPADRSQVGFIGKVRPTFNWSAVSDESGVYYNLQIATSANVTAIGFANFTVSVPRIVGTNYTLNATEALPYGTYYWIVQAVDRAGNAGNWTAARSFGAGVLPLWAFIVIIVAIVVLILTLVYFLVIRRRIHYY